MANLDFLPFQEGDSITPAKLNALVEAIQDGSIFVGTSFVGDQVVALNDRVAALEERVNLIEQFQARQRMREQFVLTEGQQTIDLDRVPLLDSESISINGVEMSKTDIPLGFVGDYTISGSVITLNIEQAALVKDGYTAVVLYDFEVT